MSTRKLMVGYLAGRYPLSLFGPLAALIYGVGCVASGTLPTAPSALAGMAIVWLLVLALRVMDDVTDREADRAVHPERIVVRANTIVPFVLLGSIACAIAGILAMGIGAFLLRTTLIAAVLVGLGVWSWLRTRARTGALVHAHVLLAKYPVIAVIASPDPAHLVARDAVPALLALYLGFCLYETLDDPAVRGARGAAPIMTFELALLAVLQIVTLTRGRLSP